MTRLVFSVRLYLLTCFGRYRTDLPSSAGRPFSVTHFLGHCFGLIPAPCSFASSAFPVPPLHHWVPSDKAAARFGSSSHSLLGAPEKWGRKRRHFHVLLKLSNHRRICWCRPRAASSAERRFKIHRSFRGHATLLKERAGGVVLENRVAPHLRFPPATGRICRNGDQEGIARPRRRRTREFNLRAPERQGQEVRDDQVHILVDPR